MVWILVSLRVKLANNVQAFPEGNLLQKHLAIASRCLLETWLRLSRSSNLYAPEHLIINVEEAEMWEGLIENAGSVFLGQRSPESVGDYASGTNHVLPTYGYARMYSGVSLDSFLKHITVQSLTEEGLRKLGPYCCQDGRS